MQTNNIDPKSADFEGGVMFVNIETNEGTLQFVAYNEHNGYYGHIAKVQSMQLSHEVVL
jgi:tRNA(Ile2) C34 agmatinyltransferase TiaS